MTNSLLFKNGRLLDPSNNLDAVADLLVSNEKISNIGPLQTKPDNLKIFDASGLIISPGFVDVHCHLREPGQEYKETIETGTSAAAAGGFTTICAMPNTIPPMDTRSIVDFVTAQAKSSGLVRVLPIGCVTKGSRGEELSEMVELSESGVIGFSDDGNPVHNPNIMRQALLYASDLSLPIINHCEVPELAAGASMNEGWVSTRLGLKGMPNSAEEVMVARDISLSELTNGHVHLAHISTAGSLSLIREAKSRGVNVTCEVTPHHLTLTDEIVLGIKSQQGKYEPLTPNSYDTMAKVNPPLRTEKDVSAMIEGLIDGTIDMIATDHAPHSTVDKMCSFQEAAFGISVLETALGSILKLFHEDLIDLSTLISKLTCAPSTFLRSNLGTLNIGAQADLTIFDPNEEWEVLPKNFKSKGKNTPLETTFLKGKVKATVYGGTIIYQDS